MRSRSRLAGLVFLTTSLGVFPGAPGSATDIFVTTPADVEADDGLCSFREAATAANTDTATGALPGECPAGVGGGDNVLFALPAGSVIALTFQPVIFTETVGIYGPGSDALEIAQAGSDRVLIFDGGASASSQFDLIGVRISGGVALTDYEGGHLGEGGGLLALRFFDMYIVDVVFSGNSALNGGGALYLDQRTGGHGLMQDSAFESNSVLGGVAGGGGAILALLDGDFTMRRVLFSGNYAGNQGFGGPTTDGQGGAIWLPPLATGDLDILACTFSGNSATGNGGAISFGTASSPGFGPFVETRIIDSTFTLNGADLDVDAPDKSGGALNLTFTSATVTLTNSIVAGNFDNGTIDFAPDLVGTTAALLATGGSNLIGIRRGAGPNFLVGLPNAAGDWVGDSLNPLDAGLEPLAANGGMSRSHMPSNSPVSFAIDRGSCTASVFDQRDWRTAATLRIYDDAGVVNQVDGCDIGAIERGLEPPTEIFVDTFDNGNARYWSGIFGWIP